MRFYTRSSAQFFDRGYLQGTNSSANVLAATSLLSQKHHMTTVRSGASLLLLVVLSCLAPAVQAQEPDTASTKLPTAVQSVPDDLRSELELEPLFEQFLPAAGYPILASTNVHPAALHEAAWIVTNLLAERSDIAEALVASKSRLIIMAHNEFTSDFANYRNIFQNNEHPLKFWDRRARGFGGSETDPTCSCGEENLLHFDGDPYAKESILIHEFAHTIHLRALVNMDPTFDARLEKQYKAAMKAGLWEGKYAGTNSREYWAEGVQSWFDNNRPPDHDHNHVDTRVELIEYDPGLAELCRSVFGTTAFTYTLPQERKDMPHLRDYDFDAAPSFAWPDGLAEWYDTYREKQLKQQKAGTNESAVR